MDSLTQIVLGAGVAAAIGGKKYGRKSALLGAFAGTLPDLDVVLFLNASPVESMTEHRGFSHSIVFCLFVTPILAWLISKIKKWNISFKDKTIHILLLCVLLTHIFLDAMTVYGTQIFWPRTTPPVGIASIFIIDLLYTLPLLGGLIWYLKTQSTRAVKIGLILSSVYLLWCFTVQQTITFHAKNQLGEQAQNYNILVQPTPFNSILWRILVIEDNQYKVAYLSLFDENKNLSFETYPLNKDLLSPIKDQYAPSRLEWFTKGFYGVKKVGQKIIISDLRMGLEPDQYVFQFVVGKTSDGKIQTVPDVRHSDPRDFNRLSLIWQRILDETVQLTN